MSIPCLKKMLLTKLNTGRDKGSTWRSHKGLQRYCANEGSVEIAHPQGERAAIRLIKIIARAQMSAAQVEYEGGDA